MKNTFHVVNYNDNLINVDIDLLTICNYHCYYCYTRENTKLLNKIISKDILERLFLKIKESKKQFDVGLLGGEPSLYPKLYDAIGKLLNFQNIHELVVFTNGSHPEKFAKIINSFDDERLKVNLSFHYTEIVKHKHENLFKKNFMLLKHKIWKITIMITSENEKEINDWYEYFTHNFPWIEVELTYPVVGNEITEQNIGSLSTKLIKSFIYNETKILTYDDVIKKNLNNFKGWKCALRYYHIFVDGSFMINCFDDNKYNIMNDNFHFDDVTYAICDKSKCVHDCMLETFKEFKC